MKFIPALFNVQMTSAREVGGGLPKIWAKDGGRVKNPDDLADVICKSLIMLHSFVFLA